MGHSSTDPCYTEISIGPGSTRIDTLRSPDILVHSTGSSKGGKPILIEKLPTVHIGMACRALSKMPEKKLAVLMKGEVGKGFPEPDAEQGEPTGNLRALKKLAKAFSISGEVGWIIMGALCTATRESHFCIAADTLKKLD